MTKKLLAVLMAFMVSIVLGTTSDAKNSMPDFKDGTINGRVLDASTK